MVEAADVVGEDEEAAAAEDVEGAWQRACGVEIFDLSRQQGIFDS